MADGGTCRPVPNILLILNDDMGYSDLGCYGGEIATPNLDRLASGGLRFTQFYNTARCCPSRASLLTGLYPHQADIGDMVGDDGIDGYLGTLSKDSATIAEILRSANYRTLMSGKWHVTARDGEPNETWPLGRGFDTFYGTLKGAGSYFDPVSLARDSEFVEKVGDDYYYTDAITDAAIGQLRDHQANHRERPFFQYLAYTAPHWPLHARPEDIARYETRYIDGWDRLREERIQRMRDLGILDESLEPSPRDPCQPRWEDAEHKEWEARRMAVYAAQIDRMDRGIGRVLDELERTGELDNTLVIFLADNGGCAEWVDAGTARRLMRNPPGECQLGNRPEIMPGPADTFQSYGAAWANASNTPFRRYKCWVHEGGISTPLIVHWPEGISARGELRHQPAQLPDIMATIIDVTGAKYPDHIGNRPIQPHEGYSLREAFNGQPHPRPCLAWEHEGNCGFRKGRWKIVREYVSPWTTQFYPQGTPIGQQPWELYDIENDRAELHNLADRHPEILAELVDEYTVWAARTGVRDWSEIQRLRESRLR